MTPKNPKNKEGPAGCKLPGGAFYVRSYRLSAPR